MNSNIDKVFEQIGASVINIQLPMKPIGTVILASITKNFRVGGRYNPLSRPDDLLGGGNHRWVNGSHLTQTSRLRSSVAVNVKGKQVDISANAIYAAIQHYGGDIKHPGGTPYIVTSKGAVFMKKDGNYPPGVKYTRPHVIGIPSHPFIVIQPEDLLDIADLIAGRALL